MKHLAIDLGAESGRVVVGEPHDDGMRMHEVHRFANGGVQAGKHVHWDALGLWREIKHGMRAAATQHGKIDTIGICTWGVDYALLDERNELMSNPITYRDHRTDGMLDRAMAEIGRETIFNHTGIQFMAINTLYQLMAERAQNPQGLARAKRFVMIPDLFHLWMTGEVINEYTNASTTQLLDMRTGQWSQQVLDAIDVPRSLFLPPTLPGTRLGKLRRAVADETGLHGAEVLVVGTHDTASAVAAANMFASAAHGNEAYISSGTWSLVGVTRAAPVITPQALQFNMTNEGGVNGTIRLLKNVMGLWLIQQCRAEWARAGQSLSYEALAAMAAASTCVSAIDATDGRLLNPTSMIQTVQAMCAETGQTVPQTVADIARCVFNSLAATCANVLREIETVTGEQIERVRVIGGGSKNTLLNSLIAQASGKPVLAGAAEATALGNLWVQSQAMV